MGKFSANYSKTQMQEPDVCSKTRINIVHVLFCGLGESFVKKNFHQLNIFDCINFFNKVTSNLKK